MHNANHSIATGLVFQGRVIFKSDNEFRQLVGKDRIITCFIAEEVKWHQS